MTILENKIQPRPESANLKDYKEMCTQFSWDDVKAAELSCRIHSDDSISYTRWHYELLLPGDRTINIARQTIRNLGTIEIIDKKLRAADIPVTTKARPKGNRTIVYLGRRCLDHFSSDVSAHDRARIEAIWFASS